MRSFMSLLVTPLDMSSAYHPQIDGQTERANRTIEDMLRDFVGPRQNDWCKYLSVLVRLQQLPAGLYFAQPNLP
jgi:hypothetical protein